MKAFLLILLVLCMSSQNMSADSGAQVQGQNTLEAIDQLVADMSNFFEGASGLETTINTVVNDVGGTLTDAYQTIQTVGTGFIIGGLILVSATLLNTIMLIAICRRVAPVRTSLLTTPTQMQRLVVEP